MPEDPGLGEAIRRLERIEELIRDGLVPSNVYDRDQRETDRRFSAVERQVEALRQMAETFADAKDVEELERRQETAAQQSGTNVRQAIYSGLLPSLLCVLTIVLQLSGAR